MANATFYKLAKFLLFIISKVKIIILVKLCLKKTKY